MIGDLSKKSTRLSESDVAELAARGRPYLESAAKRVREAEGRWVEENLAVLRLAWRVAAAAPVASPARVSVRAALRTGNDEEIYRAKRAGLISGSTAMNRDY